MSDVPSPYNTSTPPPPPPKPSNQSARLSTPTTAVPRPAPPLPTSRPQSGIPSPPAEPAAPAPPLAPPEAGWLPDIVRDKPTPDLHNLLQSPDLLEALALAPSSAHPSLAASVKPLQELLANNLALATQLAAMEDQLGRLRAATQSRLLAMRALEGQWRAKQVEQDEALRDFSAPAMYQKLGAAILDGEALAKAQEESFLEGEGEAGEREVGEFVRRVREARRMGYLRRERKERWDEGRVGGWRG